MAAAALINVPWAVGTTVGAYPEWVQNPGGTPLTTAVVAGNGSLTFTGLDDDTGYRAGALLSGVWRWVNFATPPGAADAGIPVSIFDQKGDILVGAGADSALRLPPGTVGKVLGVNPGTSTGLEWQDQTGGGVVGSVADTATVDLTLAGTQLSADVVAGSLTNAHINATAGIAYSKLNLANSITNTDLAGGIANSKLATDPLARSNHTGTQLASTVSDFSEAVDDRVNALFVAGTGISFTYNDAAGTFLVNSTGGYTDELAQDAIGGILADSATLDFTYNDATPSITGAVLDSPLLGGQNSAFHLARANHTGTQLASTVSDLSEAVDDRVAALLVAGTNTTLTYNDAAGTLTIDVTGAGGYVDEQAQDAIGTILADSATIDFTYADATPSITAVIVPGSITDSHVASGAAIALSKLAVDPLDRANHTGSQAASTIGSGTMATARLGSGTANSTTFLRGDQTWAVPPGSAVTAITDTATIDLTLTGTTLSADVIAGSIANAQISSSAAIAYSKLALTGAILNADLAGSIALSKLATDPLARANHTGSQLAATISDFTNAARASIGVSDTNSIDLTYSGGALSADLNSAGFGSLQRLGLNQAAHATTRLAITGSTDGQVITVAPTGNVATSEVTGGAVNVLNDASTGPGLVVSSTQGVTQAAALAAITSSNTAFDHSNLRVVGSNDTHVMQVIRTAGNPTNGNVLLVTGSDGTSMDTTLGISGFETAKGTIKLTHNKPTAADTNASALSIMLAGSSTEAQGIFLDTSASYVTTGKLLNLRVNGSDKLVLTGTGAATLTGTLGISATASSTNGLTFGALAGAMSISDHQGSAIEMYNGGTTGPTGHRATITQGTSGAPITTELPAVMISRVQNITTPAKPAADAQWHAALVVAHKGISTDKTMIVGIGASAHQDSTVGTSEIDACGIVGQARHTSTGSAFGSCFEGRRSHANALGRGGEIVACSTIDDDVTYASDFIANNKLVGFHMANKNVTNTARISGAGITFANVGSANGGTSFDVGIGFLSGNGGACVTADISIDDAAATGIRIGGTHATAAIAIGPASGRVGIGTLTPASALNLGYTSGGAASTATADGITFASDVSLYRQGTAALGTTGRWLQMSIPSSITAVHVANVIGPPTDGTGAATIGAAGGVRGQQILGTYTYTGNPNGVSFVGWSFALTCALSSPNTTNLNQITAFNAAPGFTLDTGTLAYSAVTTAASPLTGLAFNPSFFAPASGTSTATIASSAAVNAAGGLATGWTITSRRGLWYQACAGTAGTITTDIAVEVEDLNAFAVAGGTMTNPGLSLRSVGATVQMRHMGPVVVGANAAPTNATAVALEIQSTTAALLFSRMTTTQRDAMAALAGMTLWNTTTGKLEVCTVAGTPGTFVALH